MTAYVGRLVPLPLFFDPRVSLTDRIMLVMYTLSNQDGYATVKIKTLSALVGAPPAKVRDARKQLYRRGRLRYEFFEDAKENDKCRYYVVPPDTATPEAMKSLETWNALGAKRKTRYEFPGWALSSSRPPLTPEELLTALGDNGEGEEEDDTELLPED